MVQHTRTMLTRSCMHCMACSYVLVDNSFHQVTCIPIDDRTARIDLVDGTRAYRPRTLHSNATPVLITPDRTGHERHDLARMACMPNLNQARVTARGGRGNKRSPLPEAKLEVSAAAVHNTNARPGQQCPLHAFDVASVAHIMSEPSSSPLGLPSGSESEDRICAAISYARLIFPGANFVPNAFIEFFIAWS